MSRIQVEGYLLESDKKKAAPIVVTIVISLLEDINRCWEEIHQLCKNDVAGLSTLNREMHHRFLEYMEFTSNQCLLGKNRLTDVNMELDLGVRQGELNPQNVAYILQDLQILVQVFQDLGQANIQLKRDIDNCSKGIALQKDRLSGQYLLGKVVGKLTASARMRLALFGSLLGAAASETIMETANGTYIIGASAFAFASIGIASAINVFESDKYHELRIKVHLLLQKTSKLFAYVDHAGTKIHEMMNELRVHSDHANERLAADENRQGDRLGLQAQALIEDIYSLKESLTKLYSLSRENILKIRRKIGLADNQYLVDN